MIGLRVAQRNFSVPRATGPICAAPRIAKPEVRRSQALRRRPAVADPLCALSNRRCARDPPKGRRTDREGVMSGRARPQPRRDPSTCCREGSEMNRSAPHPVRKDRQLAQVALTFLAPRPRPFIFRPPVDSRTGRRTRARRGGRIQIERRCRRTARSVRGVAQAGRCRHVPGQAPAVRPRSLQSRGRLWHRPNRRRRPAPGAQPCSSCPV